MISARIFPKLGAVRRWLVAAGSLLAVSALFQAVSAQSDSTPGNLQVTIYDVNADTVIPNARVQIVSPGSGVKVTTASGVAVFSGQLPGTYTFKVSKPNYSVDIGLIVTIISNQTSFRTWYLSWVGPAPAAPTLVSPANGTIGLLATTLSWNTVSGAASYRVQVSTSAAFGTLLVNAGGIAGTSKAVTGLAYNNQYFWHAAATGAGGDGIWSATWSFSAPIAQLPAAPALASPTNGATGIAISPTLSWSTAALATAYQVQLSTSSTFTGSVINAGSLTATSAAISGLSLNTRYFWRAGGSSSVATGPWSAAWSFTTVVTGPAPSAPVLATPTNGNPRVSTSPVLAWGSVANAATYRLQVSNNTAFSVMVFDQAGLNGSSQLVSGLPAGIKFYWRVNAANSTGTSGWSALWSFTTASVSALPQQQAFRMTGLAIGRSVVNYELPAAAKVSIMLHDLQGRLVRQVAAGMQSAGRHEAALDPEKRFNGRYVLTFSAGGHAERKLVSIIR